MKGAKLAVALALALGISSTASSSSILVMPPDLNRSQQDFVSGYFGEGDYQQLISEKELEDYYSSFSKEGKFDENVTVSCKLTLQGMSGISVSSYKLGSITDPMLETTLATAGIRNCDVTLASPVVEDGIYSLALGIYCATMLKNNVANVYETPEVLKDVRWYSDVDMIQTDIDLGLLEYHSLVIYNNGEHSYYSTAGRILFNSLIPGCFTDKPFSNTLNLPIPSAPGFSQQTELCDLKYDGIIAVKGGTRNEIKYCKLSAICQDMINDFGGECIQYYQNITKFGFHASDQCAVTLSLEDINIAINPDELLEKYDKSYNTLQKEVEDGILDEASFKKKTKVLKDELDTALAGYKGQDGVEDMKHLIIAEADKKKVMLEKDYQLGLVSAEGKKDGIQKIYKDAADKVKKALPASMDRNNNLFIIFDSGSRGNIGQIMQTTGMIGILQKTKTENMEMPVTGNYAEGISSFDMHISSYSARTGVASTQNETQNAGHATRTIVYMLSGIKIVEDDCGKDDWWYDVKYGAFKNSMKFYPNQKYFDQKLLGKRLNLKDKATSKLLGALCPDGIITMDCFSHLHENGFSSLALLDENGKKQ